MGGGIIQTGQKPTRGSRKIIKWVESKIVSAVTHAICCLFFTASREQPPGINYADARISSPSAGTLSRGFLWAIWPAADLKRASGCALYRPFPCSPDATGASLLLETKVVRQQRAYGKTRSEEPRCWKQRTQALSFANTIKRGVFRMRFLVLSEKHTCHERKLYF